MTIIGCLGYLGSGKTLKIMELLLKFKIDTSRKYELITNFENKLTSNHMDIYDIANLPTLYDSILGIDEIEMFLDSMESTSKANRYVSYFIYQTRKRRVYLIYSAPFMMEFYNRLRIHTNYFIMCSKHHFSNDEKCVNHECDKEHFFRYNTLDVENNIWSQSEMRTPENKVYKNMNLYELFDTYELLVPSPIEQAKKKKDFVDNAIKTFEDKSPKVLSKKEKPLYEINHKNPEEHEKRFQKIDFNELKEADKKRFKNLFGEKTFER